MYVTHAKLMKIPRKKIVRGKKKLESKSWKEKAVNWIKKAKRGQETATAAASKLIEPCEVYFQRRLQ